MSQCWQDIMNIIPGSDRNISKQKKTHHLIPPLKAVVVVNKKTFFKNLGVGVRKTHFISQKKHCFSSIRISIPSGGHRQ